MFEGQPKGLYALALANTGERFGYYTMLAVFLLFLQANFGWSVATSTTIYSAFLMLVYFLPIIGGAIADKIGYGKCVTMGIFVMFLGYLFLAIPAGSQALGVGLMLLSLVMISIGTSLFKGNLQVMVGNLYDAPEMQSKRDSAFSIFYMAINIGALFAPTAAIKIMAWAQNSLGASEADSYHYAFGVACVSLIISIAIYYAFRGTFQQALVSQKEKSSLKGAATEELSAKETKDRIVALCLVFAVVIFFWMAFHQNGATLTQFAKDFTNQQSFGVESMMFDVTNLVMCIIIIYCIFTFVGAKTENKKTHIVLGAITTAALTTLLCYNGYMELNGINILCIVALYACYAFWNTKTKKSVATSMTLIVAAVALLIYNYINVSPEGIKIEAPIFQQFNPCFVVGLTPVSMAFFAWLASRKKEPSAPRKIGLGMLVAGLGYVIMVVASAGLTYDGGQRVSPNWLVSTYLVLTLAELLLSPMGISFVSKVAPPKYKGLMMGCWFGATAIGNFLVSIPGFLWGNIPLWGVWCVLVALCLISFIFIFSVMKKLEKVC